MINLFYWSHLKVMYGEPIGALHVTLARPITQLERKKVKIKRIRKKRKRKYKEKERVKIER